MIDSKQLQAEAELKRVKKARKALKVWGLEAKMLGGKGYRKDPIPESREQEYIRYAMANPMAPVDDIKLGRRGVRTRKAKDRASATMFKVPSYANMGGAVIFGMSPPIRKKPMKTKKANKKTKKKKKKK